MAENKKHKIFGLFDRPECYYVPEEEKKDSQRLLEYCQKSSPVSCIVGPNGTGRTAAAFWVYLNLPYMTHEVVYISKLSTAKDGLLKSILQMFGMNDLDKFSHRDLFKKLIEESEAILKESRNLLIIVDDPHSLDVTIWRDQFEPLLAINKIQENSFSFLVTMTPDIQKTLSETMTFDPDVILMKDYLPRQEMKSYLETRLRNTPLQDLMINDEELGMIYQKSKGHFARINELASISFQRIAHLADEEEPKEPVREAYVPPPPVPEVKEEMITFLEEEPSIEMSALQPLVEHAPIEEKKGGTKKGSKKLDDQTQIDQAAELSKEEEKEDKGPSGDDSWKIIESLLKSS